MILAVDVDYRATEAVVAGVCFEGWADEQARHVYHSRIYKIEDYEPGRFYKREMPCILQLLQEHRLHPKIIVIDGFVYLGDESSHGLGMYLYKAVGGNIPIVGVAKTPFKGTSPRSEILRGKSSKPLFITAVGIDVESAKAHVLSMNGKYRIPTLLKLADRECRASYAHLKHNRVS